MRMPVVGYFIEWMVCLGGLPLIVRHQRAADAYHSARLHELAVSSRSLIMDEVETLRGRMDQLDSECAQLATGLDHFLDRINRLNAEFERSTTDARELRHLVLSMNHWLASLRQNLAALELAEAEQQRKADALYADIASRVLSADPGRAARLESWATQIAALLPEKAQLLDLCSGDDWLAHLVGKGVDATGIDTNTQIGIRAREAGLSIMVAEPPEVLARTADQSLHALTALDVGSLLRSMPANSFLASVRRVLRPQGIVMLGSSHEPASIAARLQGRADADLENPLIMQTLIAAGFIGVRSLPASDGTICIIAQAGSERY